MITWSVHKEDCTQNYPLHQSYTYVCTHEIIKMIHRLNSGTYDEVKCD